MTPRPLLPAFVEDSGARQDWFLHLRKVPDGCCFRGADARYELGSGDFEARSRYVALYLKTKGQRGEITPK